MMALKLEDLTLQSKGSRKSLLDIILERKEKKNSIKKNRVLRPWEAFADNISNEISENKKLSKNIMQPFVKGISLTDEQKMAYKIKKRASELFLGIKF